MLSSIRRSNVHSSISSSVLFVVNNWDQLTDQEKLQCQQYLDICSKQLQSFWGPFQKEQLITINADLALAAQEAGHTTADMHALCQGIIRILLKAVDSAIIRALREPRALMNSVEAKLENAVRQLCLPLEERDSMSKLLSCKKSLESAAFIKMLDRKIEELILKLEVYLKSADALDFALKWKKPDLSATEQTFVDDRRVQDMANSRLCETICQSKPYEDFCQWAKHTLMPEILHHLKNLSQTKRLIRGKWYTSYASNDNQDNGNSVGFIAMAVPAVIIGVPLALAFGAVVCPVFGLAKVVSLIKDMNFRQAVKEAYTEIVERYCADNHTVLKKVVNSLLQTSCRAVSLIQREIPEMIATLNCEMENQVALDREDAGNYDRILTDCQGIKGHISKLVLQLDNHEYSSSDFPMAISSLPGAIGSYGKVVQVPVVGKGAGALKVLHQEITYTNAEDFVKELDNCKKLQNENVVSFFGSVIVSKTPLRLGFLFEWCGGGTLADEIFSPGNLPSCRQEGFIRGRDVLLQILNGVKYLHSHKIVHRDLKPENILLTDSKEVKLADMGLTKSVFQVTGSLCGTTTYIAPEVFQFQPYGLPADMYAIGIIMWEMWHGKRSYLDVHLSEGNFKKGIMSGELRPGSYSPGLCRRKAVLLKQREFIDMKMVTTNWVHLSEGCWTSDYSRRPTAESAYQQVMNIATKPINNL